MRTASETRDREQQLLQGRDVDTPVQGLRDPVPGLARQGVDQHDRRTGHLQGIRRRGKAFEVGDLLVQVAALAEAPPSAVRTRRWVRSTTSRTWSATVVAS
jgi:hypothetical protein